MPVQTTKTSNVYLPDGAKVSVKGANDADYLDLGAINSAVTATLNYDENQVETANAGKLDKQIRNMTIAGGFTLINLEPAGVDRLGGGMFTTVETAGTTVSSGIENQVIASGWTDKSIIPLVLDNGSTHKLTAAPTITSVTGSVDGALTANDDYSIVPDSNSGSGYSIVLNLAGGTLTTVSQTVTIVYASFVPVASTTVYAGASTATLSSYAMRITHTDDNGNIRQLELYSVDPNSGGFQFNFKGANEDGVEEMPLTFTAKLDTSKTSGRQLMAWTVQANAM